MPRLLRKVLEDADVGTSTTPTGIDVVGDLAILRLSRLTLREKKKVAASVMEEVRSVKGVFEQEGGIEGEFRLRHLRHLAGEKRTLTLHRENGCAYRVDISRCYFSPRLSSERLRVARETGPEERVLNMFAGVGPFSVPIARIRGARVTSCELNSYACRLHEENDKLNKVSSLVKVLNLDAADLRGATKGNFDRVLMPHPSQSDKFLSVALSLARKKGLIHYYRHVLGVDQEDARSRLSEELIGALPRTASYTARKVREVGPRWIEMVADIRV